jgi:hypothetical protein
MHIFAWFHNSTPGKRGEKANIGYSPFVYFVPFVFGFSIQIKAGKPGRIRSVFPVLRKIMRQPSHRLSAPVSTFTHARTTALNPNSTA